VQLEGLREAIDEVVKKQLHEREKVLGLHVRSVKQMRLWNGGLDHWSRPRSDWRR
jgi:hypothetical protein